MCDHKFHADMKKSIQVSLKKGICGQKCIVFIVPGPLANVCCARTECAHAVPT